MEINGKKIRPRVMHGLLAALLVIGGGLLLLVPGLKPDAAADPPPTTQAPGPGDGCGSQVHFFAADTTGHKFGPAAPEDLAGARAELGNRLCQDPALVVALSEYVQCKFSTPDERVAKTVDAIKLPGAWAMHVNAVLTAVDAGNPRIAPGSGSYKTMYMVSEGRLIPEVFATSPDRPNCGQRAAIPAASSSSCAIPCACATATVLSKKLRCPCIGLAAPLTRFLRSGMLDVMNADYIRTARAKGLINQMVIFRHALKNAMLSVVTVFGVLLGSLLGGSIITESVFNWPGIGTLLLQAIQQRDYGIVQGVVLFISMIFMIVNLLVDLTYAYLDPRIRYQ